MPGPAPKEIGTRAGHSGNKVPFRVVGLPDVPPPELPSSFRYFTGEEMVKVKYPPETRTWWDHWCTSILNDGFTSHDWDYLLVTAVCHAKCILGLDRYSFAELRQREAKFGSTPHDRAKLRIITVNADNAEELAEEARKRNAKMGLIGDGRRLVNLPGIGETA